MARPKNPYQEKVVITYDHPQVTATTTWKIFKAKHRPFKVDSVRYISPTGLAADATNVFAGTLQNGSTVVATIFDTDSDTGAALAADTFVDGTLSATPANRTLAADDVMSLVATEGGTATLPAGRVVVEGRYI